jgi:Tfp pilus assembly protein PilO
MTDVRRIVSEHHRAVWIIIAALVVNAGLYALVVYPLGKRVESEQAEAGDATQQLLAARRTYAAASGTVSGKKQADEELNKFYGDVLPADISEARRILFPNLPQLARDANLRTVGGGGVQAAQQNARETLRKLTLSITLAGEYGDIRRFIHELETAGEFLILESVTVTREQDAGRSGLVVTAVVSTYYRGAGDGN